MKNIFLALRYAIEKQGKGFVFCTYYIILGILCSTAAWLVTDNDVLGVCVTLFMYGPGVIVIAAIICFAIYRRVSNIVSSYSEKMKELKGE